MRRIFLAAAAALFVALAGGAQAESLRNVRGFPADQLIGATCVGTYNTGLAYQKNGRGAFVLHFSQKRQELVATFSSGPGETAYARGAAWIRGEAIAMSDVVYSAEENVQDLRVENGSIEFWTSKKHYVSGQFSGLDFGGSLDPRRDPAARPDWVPAKIQASCRKQPVN